MANRQQRRAGKKLLNKPELKQFVDQFCMDMSNMLVDSCEVAKKEADATGTKVDFSTLQTKLEVAMKGKGEELGKKVQEMVKQRTQPQVKMNIRARA